MCPGHNARGQSDQSDQDQLGLQTLTSYFQAVKVPLGGCTERLSQAGSQECSAHFTTHRGFSRLREQRVGSRLEDRGHTASQAPRAL